MGDPENDNETAQLVRTILDYCDHKMSCPAREDDNAECECGLEKAVSEAIRLGHVETTTAARWVNNGSWWTMKRDEA